MFYAYYIVVDLNLTHIYQYLFILWALRIFQKNLHGTMSLPICYTVIGPWSKFLKVVTILCNFFLTYCPTPFSNWFIATCYDPSHHIFNTFQESFWYLWCMKILSHWAKLDYFIYPLFPCHHPISSPYDAPRVSNENLELMLVMWFWIFIDVCRQCGKWSWRFGWQKLYIIATFGNLDKIAVIKSDQ